MKSIINLLNDYGSGPRHEKKHLITCLSPQAIEMTIKEHPAVFREVYHKRGVNNIYLDTPDLTFFQKSVDGNKDRLKVRIRWYGNTFGAVKKPSLEFKIKKGLIGYKVAFALPDFYLDEKLLKEKELEHLLSSANLPEGLLYYLKELKTTLINCYHRKYFLSGNKHFRVTLDTQMAFQPLVFGYQRILDPFKVEGDSVFELKYCHDYQSEAPFIEGPWPFRATKHSKYVRGIESLVLVC